MAIPPFAQVYPEGPAELQTVTVVVAQDGSGDALDIQAGIALLPPEGGTIFIREGTYVITTPIVLPDKPCRLVGMGAGDRAYPGTEGATIIDLGATSSGISFPGTIATVGRHYDFEQLTIKGDGSGGQKGLYSTGVGTSIPEFSFKSVQFVNIETDVMVNTSVAYVHFFDCTFTAAAAPAVNKYVAGNANAFVTMVDCFANGGTRGGFGTKVYLDAVRCRLFADSDWIIQSGHLADCDIWDASTRIAAMFCTVCPA
jgi:hypothetical protein